MKIFIRANRVVSTVEIPDPPKPEPIGSNSELIADYLAGVLCRDLAWRYNVILSTVYRIVNEGTTAEQRQTVRKFHAARRQRMYDPKRKEKREAVKGCAEA